MKYYQDITLLPDEEANLGFLWFKVFQQIHIALADNKLPDGTSGIAVSFPEYKKTKHPMGSRLRLFAETEQQLEQFDAEKWLARLRDYTHIKPIRLVPKGVKRFVCFKRKQVKSPEKKAKSLAIHLQKPVDKVIEYRKQHDLFNKCKLPFIYMESQEKTDSGEKNRFRLFIAKMPNNEPVSGKFDCYGLSKKATIPWF